MHTALLKLTMWHDIYKKSMYTHEYPSQPQLVERWCSSADWYSDHNDHKVTRRIISGKSYTKGQYATQPVIDCVRDTRIQYGHSKKRPTRRDALNFWRTSRRKLTEPEKILPPDKLNISTRCYVKNPCNSFIIR